jgi:geranylgeranyl pyrophosphate synthase
MKAVDATGVADAMRAAGAVQPTPVLVAALVAALGAHGVCPLDPEVPDEVWRAALVGPAADFLGRPGKDVRARLVCAGWRFAGGAEDDCPEGIARVVELLHAGSLIVDDVEDEAHERRGGLALHRLVGISLAINTGSWMYFWALAELARLAIPGALELAVTTLARCHQGQALDLATRIDRLAMRDVPAVVAATTRLKTGSLCRFATELGALAAGASAEARVQIGTFGERAGIALQMLDDLSSIGARRAKGREDLRQARPTWPWAWLAELDDPFTWARYTHDLAHVVAGRGDSDALADALVERVVSIGRLRARATLDSALVALGDGRDAIAAELRAMEHMYG